MKSCSSFTDYNFTAPNKSISPLIRDSTASTVPASLCCFSPLLFCLSLEKKTQGISASWIYPCSHGVQLLGVGFHPLRSTPGHHLRRGTSAGWDALCHFLAPVPVPVPPPAAPRALKPLLLNHLAKCFGGFFPGLFLTQSSSLISFSMWPRGVPWEGTVVPKQTVWAENKWLKVRRAELALSRGALQAERCSHGMHREGKECLWIPVCKPGLQPSADGGCCRRMDWPLQYHSSGGSDITNNASVVAFV